MLLVFGILFIGSAVYQVATGKAGGHRGVAYRSEQPGFFWLVVAIWASVGLYAIWLALGALF